MTTSPSALAAAGDAALRHLVYTSQACATNPVDVFARICAKARHHNPRLGIGGVLLFDGERFVQWLCGPSPAVGVLMARIATDPRHEALQVLADGAQPMDRAGRGWRAGYPAIDSLSDFLAAAHAPGADVLHGFLRLLASADLWPPLDDAWLRRALLTRRE